MENIEKIKQLRKETNLPLGDCEKALEESGGDLGRAKQILKERGLELVGKKSQRETKAGLIKSYVHPNKKMGVLLDIRCETDFVASNNEFQELAHEICLQIAAMDSQNKESLLEEAWIKDESKKIKDLISEAINKLGENIVIEKFVRFEI